MKFFFLVKIKTNLSYKLQRHNLKLFLFYSHWYFILDGLHEEHICGRPLGINVDKHGFLYVADAYYGIFKVKLISSDQYGML